MRHYFYSIIAIITFTLMSCGSEKKELGDNFKAPRFSGYFTIIDINETSVGKKGVTFNIENQKRRITGFAGCNSYNAEFILAKDKLDILAPISTKKACAPEQMSVERLFFKTLPKVTRYTLQNGKLTLYNKEITVMKAIYTDL